ncbi:MAG: hypothetical protein AAFU70_08460, partial [Planctomycetota bacterium]
LWRTSNVSTPIEPAVQLPKKALLLEPASRRACAIVCNWTAGSIGVLTFDVRHNAAFDLSFAARVATDSDLGGRPISGFPAFASTNETIVGADVWTTIRIPVTLSNPLLQEEVPGTFFAVASNVTVLQLLVEGIPDANIGEEVTFQFDNVSIDIPAPGAALAFGLGGLALARRRR